MAHRAPTNGHDPEEEFERRREAQREDRIEDAALSQAHPELLREQLEARFIEVLGDADISSDELDDDLDQEFAAMLSRLHMLGNITDEEYELLKPLVENSIDRIKAERPPKTGPGSKCIGEVRYIMTGEPGLDTLTPSMARKLEHAGEAQKRMLSLARDGRAFDGITKIQTAVESDTGGGESEGASKSTLARARSYLPGGS